GFAVAGPTVFVITRIISVGGKPIAGNTPVRASRTTSPAGCDPKAVVEYFGSLVSRPNADWPQPLSVEDLIALLAGQDISPSKVRFTVEGGYRRRRGVGPL